MRRSTARREEGGVANERIPPHVFQRPIIVLEEENEEVPLQEPQVPPELQDTQEPQVTQDPQEPRVPPLPQATFVEGDMTNRELRTALMNRTRIMTTQAHVVKTHFIA